MGGCQRKCGNTDQRQRGSLPTNNKMHERASDWESAQYADLTGSNGESTAARVIESTNSIAYRTLPCDWWQRRNGGRWRALCC